MVLCCIVFLFSCTKSNNQNKNEEIIKYNIYSDSEDTIYFNQKKNDNITEFYFSNKNGKTGYYIQLEGYRTTLKKLYKDNISFLEKRYYWSKDYQLDSIDLYGVIDTTSTDIYISRLMSWKKNSKEIWFEFKFMPIHYGGSNDFIFSTHNTDKVHLVIGSEIQPVNNKRFVFGIDNIQSGLNDDIMEIRFMSFLYKEKGEDMYMINPINVPIVSIEVKNKLSKDYWVTF